VVVEIEEWLRGSPSMVKLDRGRGVEQEIVMDESAAHGAHEESIHEPAASGNVKPAAGVLSGQRLAQQLIQPLHHIARVLEQSC
jgi:hypothetical protein